jgi:cytochrome c oxidase subunit 2
MFLRYGCSGCHRSGSAEGRPGAVSAPSLEGLYGSSVPLADGSFAKADERYLHDSIVLPGQQLVAGYAPIMPSYAGQIDEEDLLALIDYIESLTRGGAE